MSLLNSPFEILFLEAEGGGKASFPAVSKQAPVFSPRHAFCYVSALWSPQ